MATNHLKTAPNNDPTVAIQLSFRADLDLYLSKSAAELEHEESVLLHRLSLVKEAKALKDIPGGKFESFVFFNRFPTEVQKLVWEQLVEHDQKVFIVEAFRIKTQRRFQRKIVHFRCLFGEPDMLLSICAGSREVALKHQSIAGKFPLFCSDSPQMFLHGIVHPRSVPFKYSSDPEQLKSH
jgi:hypothetical protein